MSGKDAEKKLLTKFPNREVIDCYLYKGNYLFLAPDKKLGMMNDFSDPYFIVDRTTGSISSFLPSEDFDGFDKAVENGSIRK